MEKLIFKIKTSNYDSQHIQDLIEKISAVFSGNCKLRIEVELSASRTLLQSMAGNSTEGSEPHRPAADGDGVKGGERMNTIDNIRAIRERREALARKVEAVLVESGCTYGDAMTVLGWLESHYKLKSDNLADATNISEIVTEPFGCWKP